MPIAEKYAFPTHAEIGTGIPRTNDFKEVFYVRWGRIHFDAFGRDDLNVKVVLNVYRSDDVCERFIIDTDWNNWKRATRDFYIHPFSVKLGHVRRITFSFIVHTRNRSIPSEHEYRFIEGGDLQIYQQHHRWRIGREGAAPNTYRTQELNAAELQRDVDWCNRHFELAESDAKVHQGSALSPFSSQAVHPRPDRCDNSQTAAEA